MPIKILMPALSPTMTEGNLARWLKNEGDEVNPGDVIAEIETDKATMEVEAVDEGKLGKILVPAGTEGVAVNATIALLLEEGEDAAALEQAGGNGEAPEAPRAEPKAEKPQPAAAAAATPSTEVSGGKAPASGNGQDGRVFASPLARRMAEQAGLDLAGLAGSGPHGRIVKADIEKALETGAGKAAPAAAAEAKQPAAAAAAAPIAPAGPIEAPAAPHEVVQLSSMRKVIARRLTEAKQQIPHFYLTVDCELDALLAMRSQLNARPGADYKLSVNDFVIKAVAVALRRKPGCNASWGGDKVFVYKDVDVSVAVAIDGGLITPIIRQADQKGLSTISREMKDLAARAREGKLKPEEYQGGGFSISNLGMYGIRDFQAVINPPQSCILAIGAGEKRPVVKNDALAIATVMSVTLSIDHRVVDGALGAEFLGEFKKLVEDPMGLLL
ncbi:pyruvate dehydrogenase complex dihydrolipoamide acetyltransferase [Marinimicrococcus flavescens]|uniref:Acetyltransferase component of pyruvate dehydrogenase complex n=1 Tax=Marinimicrococcus flavescens TaxID=3031815 RepID=A0AAP4D694_9PROT|nr:pyruvate dehydrogenase complex dihydrolipoamide acetyltransferase [Marinimicrococcus flavescens]